MGKFDKKKIALLGMAADPPHCGHRDIARIILKNSQAKEVWLVPCFKHPFDKKMASARHRWQMAKFLEDRGVKASNIELSRNKISYTVDTVSILKKKYPHYDFFWVLGSDIVRSGSYKKWKNWKKLASLTDFLVVIRQGFELKVVPPGFILVKGIICNVSSTEIRNRIRRELSIKGLVHPKVEQYIKKHNLYKGRCKQKIKY